MQQIINIKSVLRVTQMLAISDFKIWHFYWSQYKEGDCVQDELTSHTLQKSKSICAL